MKPGRLHWPRPKPELALLDEQIYQSISPYAPPTIFIRKVGSDWLLTTFTIVAGEANRAGASLQLTREDHPPVQDRPARDAIIGPRVNLANEMRKLSIEDGLAQDAPRRLHSRWRSRLRKDQAPLV